MTPAAASDGHPFALPQTTAVDVITASNSWNFPSPISTPSAAEHVYWPVKVFITLLVTGYPCVFFVTELGPSVMFLKANFIIFPKSKGNDLSRVTCHEGVFYLYFPRKSM